jgi:GWxTD domain-containing protein
MKRTGLLVVLSVVCWFCVLPSSLGLQGSVEVLRFRSPDGPYVELSFFILGGSLHHADKDSVIGQPSVGITYIISKEGTVVRGDKYNLVCPASSVDFIDMKRLALVPGDYIVDVEIIDNADSLNRLSIRKAFSLSPTGSEFFQSDLQLLSILRRDSTAGPLVKHNYYMEPLPFDYYHQAYDRLSCYSEFYDLDLDTLEFYFYTYSIIPIDRPDDPVIASHKKLENLDIQPVFIVTDISGLTSGRYKMVLELKNGKQSILSSKEVTFDRSNPETDLKFIETKSTIAEEGFTADMEADQLRYNLKAIAPIVGSTQNEVLNYLIKKGEIKSQRFFLFNFWMQRNSADPKLAFDNYMEIARAIDNMYQSGFGYGFETDRGHIYLKYGQPDDIVEVEDEPSAPPYEIWIYNTLPVSNQSNVKFLFYNPSLGTNDFELLHSTAIGEIQNPRWEVILYGAVPNEIEGANYRDATRMQDNINRNARRYFNDY